MILPPDQSLDIVSLLHGYRQQLFTPADLIDTVLSRIEAELEDSHNIWITRFDVGRIRAWLDALAGSSPADKPLYGIPFAIKDNIDLGGVTTTAACPEYAYRPDDSAFAIDLLIAAGAIPVGKTNLDQFATGLVGTRSPYGPGRCSFEGAYISGGSSSGSALAVALGLASFALGTDTAGSGRVPAAFNNLIGLKPTRGLVSTRGVVPACRSLDCVSIFAVCASDAARVLDVCAEFDAADDYSRQSPASSGGFDCGSFSFGVPRQGQLEFFGNSEGAALFDSAVSRLESLGGRRIDIDFEPFLDAARLLYEGPWVSERYVAIRDFMDSHPDAIWPVTRDIISAGASPRAADAFAAQYRLARLRRAGESTWQAVDCLITPTAGRQYRIAEVDADPVKLNSNLGYYTNFMNLLDLCAVAAPAGFQQNGLPFGVTLFAPAFHDQVMLRLADRLHRGGVDYQGAMRDVPLPPSPEPAALPDGWIRLVVCGAHMTGLPLNHQLTERGAYLLDNTRTSANYRLYALPGGPPNRPGLVRCAGGVSIEVEVWALPLEHYGSFVDGIPAPLGIGRLQLESGDWLQGFLCEPYALEGATDISRFGGWSAYIRDGAAG